MAHAPHGTGPAHGEVWLCVSLEFTHPFPAIIMHSLLSLLLGVAFAAENFPLIIRSFKDGKFGGHVWKFHESQPDFADLGCNDKVSSVRVGPGTTVILFNDKKYGGGSLELNVDASSLGKFNDKSSSMKIIKECVFTYRCVTKICALISVSCRAPQHDAPHPGEVFVYRDANFEGYVWRLKESCPDVAKIGAPSLLP